MKALENNEAIEQSEIKERNKNLQNYLKIQMGAKKAKAEEEFLRENENSYKTRCISLFYLAILNDEQNDFLKYAESWIQEYQASGKDIQPLLIELRNYKKKMFYG